MPQTPTLNDYETSEGRFFGMNILMTSLAIAFVVSVLLLVAYSLFELSPFAHHADSYHKRGQHQDSPRLD